MNDKSKRSILWIKLQERYLCTIYRSQWVKNLDELKIEWKLSESVNY